MLSTLFMLFCLLYFCQLSKILCNITCADGEQRSKLNNRHDHRGCNNINLETYKTHFITIMTDTFEIDLKTWGRASIVDTSNAIKKTAGLLNIPHV